MYSPHCPTPYSLHDPHPAPELLGPWMLNSQIERYCCLASVPGFSYFQITPCQPTASGCLPLELWIEKVTGKIKWLHLCPGSCSLLTLGPFPAATPTFCMCIWHVCLCVCRGGKGEGYVSIILQCFEFFMYVLRTHLSPGPCITSERLPKYLPPSRSILHTY